MLHNNPPTQQNENSQIAADAMNYAAFVKVVRFGQKQRIALLNRFAETDSTLEIKAAEMIFGAFTFIGRMFLALGIA